jgi:hypothetical protein
LINWTEIVDGDTWELFARDFLAQLDFVIEVGPGRGPDAGRDLLISEQLTGKLHTQAYKWLVSCKHFAKSNRSVGIEEETSITDRVRQHSADGFMGFYSTMPSAALVQRLHQYVETGQLNAYEIFDPKKIENYFVNTGMSKLTLRYFPNSYGKMRPIQLLLGKRVELNCDVCGSDLLAKSVGEGPVGNLVWACSNSGPPKYRELFAVCIGECDHTIQERIRMQNQYNVWESIRDLCNPILYLKNMLTYMNQLHKNPNDFSEAAHNKMKDIYVSLAQRTLREVTTEDFQRFKDLRILDYIPH